MVKNKRPKDRPTEEAGKVPVRFVRRRRSSRKTRPGAGKDDNATAVPSAKEVEPPEPTRPLIGQPAQRPQRWNKAPRPAEVPPRNPNVFSYTHTVWKS